MPRPFQLWLVEGQFHKQRLTSYDTEDEARTSDVLDDVDLGANEAIVLVTPAGGNPEPLRSGTEWPR